MAVGEGEEGEEEVNSFQQRRTTGALSLCYCRRTICYKNDKWYKRNAVYRKAGSLCYLNKRRLQVKFNNIRERISRRNRNVTELA